MPPATRPEQLERLAARAEGDQALALLNHLPDDQRRAIVGQATFLET